MYCNTQWVQETKVGTLHHFCQLEKDHATEHGCVTCDAMHVTFDEQGVKFLEVPC